ncbi:MurR/RpiR family transcriptional regulator [Thomasclavelia sp.]|uniref:MurR/RpiR family transcriptional regulator n=1 Tax=Thomasclavelia sp. TaxID=3025757 RepID=UPI0025DE702E|nr:MurR/RpiR family transcriptional regulator [Thomasclavelia sp.]
MLIEQKLETVKLSSAQQAVIDYFFKEREKIKNKTIKMIAKETYTSSTTVVRLAKKLGYHGFEDFKDDFLKEINYLDTHFNNIDPNYPFVKTDNLQKISSKVTTLVQETINDTLNLIEHDSMQQAVRLLSNANQIHLAAISYSLLLGQMFQLDMMRIGVAVNICSIVGEELFTPAIIKKEDCVIFISYSGEIDQLCSLAKMVKEKGAKVIAITGLGNNRLKKYSDVILSIATREKLYSKIAGFCNEYSIKLILDILYSNYFVLNYDDNLKQRIAISKSAEVNRKATIDVMKEKS